MRYASSLRPPSALGERRITLMLVITALTGVSFALGLTTVAWADCAAGDGVLASPGTCNVPQILTGSTGVVASSVTLGTGPSTTAYTISSNNAAVTNAGTVTSQGPRAFFVGSSGSSLLNSGTISANQGTGIAVTQSGSLDVTNTGNIIGGNGRAIEYISNPGAPVGEGTITQAGGSVTGNVLLSGFTTTLNVTGGTINGAVLDQTPASGAAGSSQGRGGIVNFDLGTGSFATNGNINVGAINVRSGTLVLQNDVYVSGGQGGPGLTNNATLQISGTRTLTGSFVQNASGTLVMQVTPQGSSQLVVQRLPFFGGRTAALAGTLALAYQPGTYQARSYTLISTDTSNAVFSPGATLVSGSFSQVTGVVPTPGLSQRIAINPFDVQLILEGEPAGGLVGGAVVAPTNTAIFSTVPSAVLLNGQRITGMILDRLGNRLAGIADGGLAAADAAPVRLAQAGGVAAPWGGAGSPGSPVGESPWFRGIGDFLSVRGNAAAPGFNGSAGGFLTGLDRPIGPDVSVGIAGGFVHSDLTQRPIGSGSNNSGRFAVYGGSRFGSGLLTGTAGYAYDRLSTDRSIAGVGTAKEAHNSHELSIAGQWSRPSEITGIVSAAVVTPKIGIQFLHLFEDSFRETGVGGFGLTSGGNDADSVQPYIGLAASEKFVTADGTEIAPEIRLGYSRELADNRRLVRVAAADGTPFVASGLRPSRDMLTGGVGVVLRARDSLLLYANYDALLRTGNTAEHTVSAGLRLRF